MGASLPPRYRMLAAVSRFRLPCALPGRVRPGSCLCPQFRAALRSGPWPWSGSRAMAGSACRRRPRSRRVRGLDLVRHGVDSLRQQLARAVHAPYRVRGKPGSAAADPGQPADGATLIRAPGSHRASPQRTWPALDLPWIPGPPSAAVILAGVRSCPLRRPDPGDPPGGRARLKRGKPMADGNAGGIRPGAASAHRGPDGIRVLSQVGPGRQGGLAGVLPPGVSAGFPRQAAWWPGQTGWPGPGRAGGARRAGTSAGAAVPWGAVTVPACRDARPGTG